MTEEQSDDLITTIAYLTVKDASIVKLVEFTGELFFFRLETATIAGSGVWQGLQKTPRGPTQRLPGRGQAIEMCSYNTKDQVKSLH